MNACSSCDHFVRLGVEPKGYCNGLPPTIFASGVQARPQVKEKDRACSLFKPLEGEPAVKEKTQPPTHGAVVKAAREAKLSQKPQAQPSA